MKCICKEWKKNITKLNDVIMIAYIHGLKYRGKQFKYCPWCGKKLIKEKKIIS